MSKRSGRVPKNGEAVSNLPKELQFPLPEQRGEP